MIQIFASPSTYIQGTNLLFNSKEYIQKLANKVILLTGPFVYDLVGTKYSQYLQENQIDTKIIKFNGETSVNEINRVSQIGKDFQAGLIIGLGGGKVIDTVKAVADNLDIAVAILPTIASTDAPCSRLSVIYNDDGSFASYRFYAKNPDLVLVDTDIIAHSPLRLLVSGIADALATNVEAQAVARGDGNTMLAAKQTLVGNAIAEKCEETLFQYGLEAAASIQSHAATKALNKIVEANTLMSGVGFESGGLAAAHAIHNGLTALKGPVHEMTHGEKVAFGTLTQLFLEGAAQERFEKFLKFDLALGLPTTLADLHLDKVSDDDLLKVGQQATKETDTMKEMPFHVSAEDVRAAMKGVDAYSRSFQK